MAWLSIGCNGSDEKDYTTVTSMAQRIMVATSHSASGRRLHSPNDIRDQRTNQEFQTQRSTISPKSKKDRIFGILVGLSYKRASHDAQLLFLACH